MTKHIARLSLTLFAFALGLALCLGLCACGKGAVQHEKLVGDSIGAKLDGISTLDSDLAAQLFEGVQRQANLESLGLTAEEFCKAWLSGFSYEVTSVSVDGQEATANVTLRVKDFNEVVAQWMDSLGALTSDPALQKEVGQMSAEQATDVLNKNAGELLIAAFNGVDTKKIFVELPCQKSGDSWELSEGFDEIVVKALLGSLSGLDT